MTTNRTNRLKGKTVKSRRKVNRKRIDSLDVAFDNFFDDMVSEGRADGTLRQYQSNYRYFVEYLDDKHIEKKLSAIDKGVIRGYVIYMLREKVKFEGHKYKTEKDMTVGLSPQTVNTRMKTIKVFFRHLHNEGVIDSCPVEGIGKVKEYEDGIQILNKDEIRRLLNAPDCRKYSDFRDFVLMNLLLDGMLRITEAVTLTVHDVDIEELSVTIRAKNAKSRKGRLVPLQRKTVKLIRELVQENRQDFDSEYIFLTNYGEPIDRNLFNKRLKIYAKRAVIEKNIHPHLFRHTAATMFLESGGDIRHLQLLLGHKDLRMVLRYTHLSNNSLRNQHEKHSPLNNLTDKRSKDRRTTRKF